MRIITLVIAIIIAAAIPAHASVINVPDDYRTIQAAVDWAADGDTVLVADGTYTGVGNKDIEPDGKAVTIVSTGGPDFCIIDCESDGRGFWFRKGEDPDTVVQGFTVRNGLISCLT